MKATKIKTLNESRAITGERLRQQVWRVAPPIEGHEYVVASSCVVPGSGAEVLVFPADEGGKIVSYLEVGGYRGGLSHEEALRRMGYMVDA